MSILIATLASMTRLPTWIARRACLARQGATGPGESAARLPGLIALAATLLLVFPEGGNADPVCVDLADYIQAGYSSVEWSRDQLKLPSSWWGGVTTMAIRLRKSKDSKVEKTVVLELACDLSKLDNPAMRLMAAVPLKFCEGDTLDVHGIQCKIKKTKVRDGE